MTQRVVVITGGTDGMGKQISLSAMKQGHRVILLGGSADKAAKITEIDSSQEPSAIHLPADLSSIEDTESVVARLEAMCDRIDDLVLCARYYNSRRTQSREGVEHTFALFYLNRFLLSHRLEPLLQRSEGSVILNVAGPGAPPGTQIYWEDLQLRNNYHGAKALTQAGRLNDLLGVSFAQMYAADRVNYVLWNPGAVATSFAGSYDKATARHIEAMKRTGKPVTEAVNSMMPVLFSRTDAAEPLRAYVEGSPLSLASPMFDVSDSLILHRMTEDILHSIR